MEPARILKVEGVCKSFDDVACLSNVSFELHKGELLGIVGGNASSKTTLIKAISGARTIEKGKITVIDPQGNEVVIRNTADARANGIAVLHEDAMIYNHFSVAENIYFGAYSKANVNHGCVIRWSNIYKTAEKLCNDFDFKVNVRQSAATLSIAEKQIIALLHVLVLDTRILIIDEAFSALGAYDTEKVLRIIQRLNRSGVSVILLSQSPEHIKHIADSIIFISDGKISEKIERVNENFQTKLDELSQFLHNAPFPKLEVPKGRVLMECANLSYKHMVKDVSFEVHQGEILGIVGTTGSGRTTLARLLCGDLQASSGIIRMGGCHININTPVDARKNKICAILDDREQYGIIPAFSLSDNLLFPNYSTRRRKKASFFINKKTFYSHAQSAIDKLAIKCTNPSQGICELSAGNQQKILVARGFIAKAELFIFDEPTRGLDNAGKIQIYNLLNEISMSGRCAIFITSDIPEAIGMCDHVLVLREGTLVGDWTRGNMSGMKIHDDLYEPASETEINV